MASPVQSLRRLGQLILEHFASVVDLGMLSYFRIRFRRREKRGRHARDVLWVHVEGGCDNKYDRRLRYIVQNRRIEERVFE